MRPRVTEHDEGVLPMTLRQRLRATVALLPQLDWLMVAVAAAVAAVGVMCIYSAGYRGADLPASTSWQRQILWLAVGGVAFLLTALFDYRWLCRWSWVLYLTAVGMLVTMAILQKAIPSVFGAKRWLPIGPFQLQPSEFAKLGLVLMLAWWLGDKERDPRRWGNVLLALTLMAVPLVLIVKQPDLGSAMVLAPMTLVVLFVARARTRYLAAILAAAVVMAPLAYGHLKPYQQKRLLVFLRGSGDPSVMPNEGWNLAQSKIAVGSGGVWGKGWRQGAQSRLGFLPVASKDFIFAVFAEERGFVGSALLLLAYAVLLGLGLKIAAEATDRTGALLATGVVTMLFTHVTVNVGMTIGLLPITGLPLPLMSYGGSFALTTLLALGLLQSVRVHRRLY